MGPQWEGHVMSWGGKRGKGSHVDGTYLHQIQNPREKTKDRYNFRDEGKEVLMGGMHEPFR